MTMSEKFDDLQALKRFKNGDISAFEELVLNYQDRIYNLCLYMLGSKHDAEDAAQDTFLKAYRSLNDFKPNASLYTWIYRIAVNTCIDYKRKPLLESLFRRSDTGEEVVIEHPSDSPSPEKVYESKQIQNALQEALRKLSPKLRAVIVLKEMEGLSYEEIADTLDVSIGTVKSRISRARDELKILLKDFREQK
ncbi:MAG: sigma-70 family RNA polymerase sigma factor [Thermodesulfovibrionales bacterium]|nr:sigma-70 family RNA polymerase sigma factor [Thermodesulfovibrionales bacterium]